VAEIEGLTPEQQTLYNQRQAEAEAELQRRIAEGTSGDQPPELTEEDEEILDRIWTREPPRAA